MNRNSIIRMRFISTGIAALLVLAGFVSASHIVDTAGTLGLSGWYRFAAVALIDFVAIVGKLSMYHGFSPAFRRSGLRLLMAGGALSLTANVYAGDNLGEKVFGALTVAAFLMLEHHAAKGGRQAVTTTVDPHAERLARVVAELDAAKAARESEIAAELAAAAEAAAIVRAAEAAELAAKRRRSALKAARTRKSNAAKTAQAVKVLAPQSSAPQGYGRVPTDAELDALAA